MHMPSKTDALLFLGQPNAEHLRIITQEAFSAINVRDVDKAIDYIERGASLTAKDSKGRTLLVKALGLGLEEVAIAAIRHGSPTPNPFKGAGSMLIYTCRLGCYKAATLLLERNKYDYSVTDCEGKTIWHHAAKTAPTWFIEKLIAHDAPIDIKDYQHFTPLNLACKAKNIPAALALIEAGADVTIANIRKTTPLAYAVHYKLEPLITPLLARGASSKLPSYTEYQELHTNSIFVDLCRKQSQHSLNTQMLDTILTHDKSLVSDQETLEKGFAALCADASLRDMVNAFTRHVIIPQIFLGFSADSINAGNILRLTDAIYPHIIPIIAGASFGKSQKGVSSHDFHAAITRLQQLSNTWHHPAISFPAALQPVKGQFQWHPLWHGPVTLSNGLSAICLTSSLDLKEESRMLNHCVGRSNYYAQKCCHTSHDERSHIISLRDGSGQPISTLELKIVPTSSSPNTNASQASPQIVVIQHHGQNNENPPTQAKEALKELLGRIESRTIPIDFDRLGQTTENAEQQKMHTPLSLACGYHPSQPMIDACFDEYRMPYRRASIKHNSRQLRYSDEQAEDGFTHKPHFISGFVLVNAQGQPLALPESNPTALPTPKRGETVVDLRSLDVQSWLRVNGIFNAAQQEVKKLFKKEALDALQAAWDQQSNTSSLTFRPLPIPRHVVHSAIRDRSSELTRVEKRENPMFV